MLAKKLESAAKAVEAVYIEDVFSTWLYTGNGSTQTINNGIDLAGEGGLVWIKDRTAARSNFLFDTLRGATYRLISNTTAAQNNEITALGGFNSTGFSTGYKPEVNESGETYASWTFRKQPKFFDVVTYTGNGANRTIAHNLGSVPGCIIVKRTDAIADWQVYHRSLANTQYMVLNSTAAVATGATRWNSTTPTSTVFSVGTDTTVNANGGTYVAYLFAHDAGGFGLSGTDNVVSCGSFTTDASGNAAVNLEYEPQWLLFKRASSTGNWTVLDNMRGWATGGVDAQLYPNLTNAEGTAADISDILTIGFSVKGISASSTYIYIAIRRGPMKVPTDGTSVFSPIAQNNTYGTKNTTNFPVDLQIATSRNAGAQARRFVDRLRGISTNSTGAGQVLESQSTAAETSDPYETLGWDNTGYKTNYNYDSTSSIFYNLRRAPGFFDEVCYTGNDTAGATQAHNLGVAPELMIVKRRNQADGWFCYHSALGATKTIILNDYQPAVTTSAIWNNTAPSASVFTLGWDSAVNGSGSTYVAYLFATVAGVSKVGSYTGTGTTQQINCGFTAGARFVLIKRTNGSGDSADGWYVWDSARGIVSGNDPYLLLNSTAAEVTTTDWVDPASTGFELSSVANNFVNINGATYIYLAIA